MIVKEAWGIDPIESRYGGRRAASAGSHSDAKNQVPADASCTTVMVCPATVTVPVRGVGPFGIIKSETMVLLPGGKLGRILIHVEFETAVHEHELAVATDSVAPPPAPDTDNEVGDTAYVQDGAAVLPQRTSAAAHAMMPARRTARGIGNLHSRSYAGSERAARARGRHHRAVQEVVTVLPEAMQRNAAAARAAAR
jgi:hypothetical protein